MVQVAKFLPNCQILPKKEFLDKFKCKIYGPRFNKYPYSGSWDIKTLVLTDNQYVQNVAFIFEKISNGQNHFSSDSHLPTAFPTLIKGRVPKIESLVGDSGTKFSY